MKIITLNNLNKPNKTQKVKKLKVLYLTQKKLSKTLKILIILLFHTFQQIIWTHLKGDIAKNKNENIQIITLYTIQEKLRDFFEIH